MTPKKQYTVKKEDLLEVRNDKVTHGKQFGFLVFDFGKPVHNETYVAMTLAEFMTLYDVYKEASDI